MKASDLFVKALEAEGVEYVFGMPGEENADLLASLRGSSIKLILTRHEQGAGFMAATYGRLTGKAGVCLSRCGFGATNLVTPATYAQLGAMPMLMITEQKPIKSRKQSHFHVIDIVGMMRYITKFTHQVESGDRIPSIVREAFRLAHEERLGTVHIELPEDIAVEQIHAKILKPSISRRPIADDNAVAAAISMIKASQSPLLLIGLRANRKLTAEMLREFVDKTNIPFVTTQMGKGVINECDPRFVGNIALSDGDFVHRAIAHADLIINVGHDTIERPPFSMRHKGSKMIHVNFDSAAVESVYFPQLEVVGDIANSILKIKEGLTPQETWKFDFYKDLHCAYLEHRTLAEGDNRFPVLPERLVSDIRKVMPDDGIVTLDSGVFTTWFTRNYPVYYPNTLLLENAHTSVGVGLPSAIAAKLVNPDVPVLSVCGDGGFMMNSQEIETAVRLKLDLVVIILRGSVLDTTKWNQASKQFEEFVLDYGNPNFVKYAQSYGAYGWRVDDTDVLIHMVDKCLNTPGVHIIDCPVDYSMNDKTLHHTIKALSAKR